MTSWGTASTSSQQDSESHICRALMFDNYVSHPSGLMMPDYVARAMIKKQRRPVAIDLFAGAGGMSLGIIQAGFEVVAASDNDGWAAITYTYNLGAYPMKFDFLEQSDYERMEVALRKE